MNWKIVADSSANLLAEAGVVSVPLRIMVGEREFVDDTALDVPAFLDALYRHKGRSSTACPGIGDWLAAFEGADAVFAVTITGALSGSCNAARLAGEQYEKEHPDTKVYVLDSLSTGPEMRLLTQRIRMQLEQGEPPEQVWQDVQHDASHTRLLFSLGSLHNLAQNGRVNPAVAAAAGLLGIRVVGQASDKGELDPLHKCRGEARALETIVKEMTGRGYRGGRVHIDHCENEDGAHRLCQLLRQRYPGCEPTVGLCGGLCSYYAERGGLLVGYEI